MRFLILMAVPFLTAYMDMAEAQTQWQSTGAIRWRELNTQSGHKCVVTTLATQSVSISCDWAPRDEGVVLINGDPCVMGFQKYYDAEKKKEISCEK